MKKFRLLLHVAVLVAILIFASRVVPSFAQNTATIFTPETLAQYDGKNGHLAYIAYKGVVYNVTGLPDWKEGEHYGNLAGQDLTGMMAGAPHGEEVLAKVPIVGSFSSTGSSSLVATQSGTGSVSPSPSPAAPAKSAAVKTKAWYEPPITIAGLTIIAWSGILLGVSFILNFLTCFALPFSKLPLPWKGSRPGKDSLDVSPTRLRWATIHKYFAWSTVVFGIIHGTVAIMQLLGFYI